MSYEDLLIEADNNLLITKEKPLRANKGRIKGRNVAIKKDMNTLEKSCTLAEELGHYYTTTGNILDESNISNQKQEHYARVWAYNKLIGLHGIISAYEAGCKNKYDVAEHLNVTEEFLNEAIEKYTSKYGICTTLDNYVIYFIPNLAIMELA